MFADGKMKDEIVTVFTFHAANIALKRIADRVTAHVQAVHNIVRKNNAAMRALPRVVRRVFAGFNRVFADNLPDSF